MITPKVAVLLAGYKGHKYIYEQVLSLLVQKGVYVEIFIRIDGDCEIFSRIVSDLDEQYPNIHALRGDVISSSGMNFYNLILGMENSSFDYYALCDQDDIWYSEKLARAISFFETDSVFCYSSGFTTFLSNGLKKSYSLGNQTKLDYMFQAGGPGCTFVFSHQGFEYIRTYLLKHARLRSVLAHDWLVYFIVRLNGKRWVIDDHSSLLYRQHSTNVAGVNSGFGAKIKRLKILFNGWYIHDLLLLHGFAREQGLLLEVTNPFNLRRRKLQSIFIWLYFWLYASKKISGLREGSE